MRRVLKQWGADNTSWKGGTSRSTVRRRVKEALKEAGRDLYTCERCQLHLTTELPRHHKDRDRSNNDASNIEVLCWTCHNLEHMHEAKRDKNGQFLPKPNSISR